MERVACLDEVRVEKDLVGFAEGEGHLVGGHDFAVLLRAAGAHFGGWMDWMVLNLVGGCFPVI